MIKDEQRLELYLENSERGFFVIEVCDYDIRQKVINKIKGKKNALVVDFEVTGTEFYNQEIKNKEYNCVVFCNLEMSENAVALIDGFNMNRDNFVANGIMYIFIVPKYLDNYLIIKTPNLNSYITGRVNLCRDYLSPFRPLLSLDNYVIDKEQIGSAKRARRNLKSENITNYKEVLDNVEYYKYYRATNEELLNVLHAAAWLSNLEESKLAEKFATGEFPYRNEMSFFLEFAKVAFNQEKYEVAEVTCVSALSIATELRNAVIYWNGSEETKKHQRAFLYTIIGQSFTELDNNRLNFTQLIELVRVYAGVLFYQRYYDDALDWFNLANTIIDYYNEGDLNNVLCLNFCDMSLCYYKQHADSVNGNSEFYFDKALKIKEESKLDVKTLFVLDYNDLVYKIKDKKVRYEDYNISSCRADYYKSVCSEKSSIFTSYLSLVAWVRGCVDGNIFDALELNSHALTLKRAVLTENHYSIAESCYCAGVLYYMRGNMKVAREHLQKALSILGVNSKRNHTLIDIVTQFKESIDNS